MIDLAFLGNCDFFTQVTLGKNEVLFDEGAEDKNLYIIYEGELVVEKKIQSGSDYKILSYIRTGNILGEGGLSNKVKKEVRIRSIRHTLLLKIASENFVNFVRSHPSESYELLIHIISHSNDRLLKANSEITANYEISQAIAHIKNFDTQSIEELLSVIKTILNSESIMYLEKNTIMPGYYKLRYREGNNVDTIGDTMIVYFHDDIFGLQEFKNQKPELLQKYCISASLMHGGILKGYLVISRNGKKYSENEQKLIENAAISFAGVMSHKDILETEKNKKHIKNI